MKKLSELIEHIEFEELFFVLRSFIKNNKTGYFFKNNSSEFDILSSIIYNYPNRIGIDKIFSLVNNLIENNNKFYLFVKRFYYKLDFDLMLENYNIKNKLIKFYNENTSWVFEDIKRFLISLKVVKYNSALLEIIIKNYPYLKEINTNNLTEDEKNIYNNFWLAITKYQNLTYTFIQKYYLIFLNNEQFAINLVRGKNQFHDCNMHIVKKILMTINKKYKYD